MSDLVSWFAFGVSVTSSAALWVGIVINRRTAAKDKTAKVEMAEYVRRLTEALERNFLQSASEAIADTSGQPTLTREGEVGGESSNGSQSHEAEWIIDNRDASSWTLRNIGAGVAHDVRIDRSNLNGGSIEIEGETSVITRLGSVDIKIQPGYKKPLPQELLVAWQEHPEPVAVPLPQSQWR